MCGKGIMRRLIFCEDNSANTFAQEIPRTVVVENPPCPESDETAASSDQNVIS
jgi:hypothetical protein